MTVISKAISDRNERGRIQDDIQKKLRKEFDQKIREIQAYLLLKDYEISNLSIHQTISEIDLNNIRGNNNTGIALDSLLEKWVTDSHARYRIDLQHKIKNIPANELRKLKIHRYPLVLQDISEALQVQGYLYSSNLLPVNQLDHLVEQQLKLFLCLLALMTYANDDKDKYVLPRLGRAQLNEFKSTFRDLKEYFDQKSSGTKCNQYIERIGSILSSDIKQEFDFSIN